MNTSIIDRHNDLFTRIGKAITYEEMSDLYTEVKSFVDDYESIDSAMTERISTMYMERLNTLLVDNDKEYEVLSQKVESIKNRQYSYNGEVNDVQAVQNRTLQLMAELPKAITSANASMTKTKLNAVIASGTVGSKAVLELLKYPSYANMVDEQMKLHALVGSKSDKQLAFEEKQSNDLKQSTDILTSVYTQGFHLRKLKERVTGKSQMFKFH